MTGMFEPGLFHTGMWNGSAPSIFPEANDIRSFGAGSGTDDTAAIQAAIDWASQSTVYPQTSTAIKVPRGVYKITAPLVWKPFVSILFDEGAIIQARAAMPSMLATETVPSLRVARQSLINSAWDCNGLADTGVHLYGFAGIRVWGIRVRFPKKYGIRIGNGIFNCYELDLKGADIHFNHHVPFPVTGDVNNPGSAQIRSDGNSDSTISDVFGLGGEYGMWGKFFGTVFSKCHPWTFAGSSMRACYHSSGEGCRYVGVEADLGHDSADGLVSSHFHFTYPGVPTHHFIVGSSTQYYGGPNPDNTDCIIRADAGVHVLANTNKFQGSPDCAIGDVFRGEGVYRGQNNSEQYITNVTGDTVAEAANELIDPYFDVWLGNTSATADGQKVNFATLCEGIGAAVTLSRQTFAEGQTAVPGAPRYFMRMARTVTGSSSSAIRFAMPDVRRFAGRRAWFSGWMRCSVPTDILIRGGANWAGSSQEFTADAPRETATSWKRFSLPLDVPGAAGKSIGDGNSFILEIALPTAAGIADFDIAAMGLMIGVAPVAPKRSTSAEVMERTSYFMRSVRVPLYTSASKNSVVLGPMQKEPTLTVAPDSGFWGTFSVERDADTGVVTLTQATNHSANTTASVLLDARI